MKTVNQVAKLAGVSVRTLHYYDEIDLLKPTELTESGYRLYNHSDFLKLEQILFFKEIGFPLKEIKSILEHPDYNQKEALTKQREILTLQKERTEKLIRIINRRLEGAMEMNFEAFDMKTIEQAKQKYQQETEERWGSTSAYKESQEKTKGYNKEDWSNIMSAGAEIFKGFAAHLGEDVSSEAVQGLVKAWQDHITKNFYACTKEILAGLGQMYALDERFANNINQYGEGVAEYMSEAIAYYCEH
ncbi:MAG: MerR family transcriptional regulator [Cellulosilyticaceae bacterium]